MLRIVNRTPALDRDACLREVKRLQLQFAEIACQLRAQKRPAVIVYEGRMGAGKRGSIKRVTAQLDADRYVIHAVGAPEGEDAAHHYLYAFWRRLPVRGQIVIFNRSWYRWALSRRVEGLYNEHEWQRACNEINAFERQLVDFGTILVKFWIHISPDVQLRRFQTLQDTSYSPQQTAGEDWRDMARWAAYDEAVSEMLLRTSTIRAPWTIVEGNDKWWARLKTLRTLVEVFSKELDYEPHKPARKATKDRKKGSKAGEKEKPRKRRDTRKKG